MVDDKTRQVIVGERRLVKSQTRMWAIGRRNYLMESIFIDGMFEWKEVCRGIIGIRMIN